VPFDVAKRIAQLEEYLPRAPDRIVVQRLDLFELNPDALVAVPSRQDAAQQIRLLREYWLDPCPACGLVGPPVLEKPERESAEWWDDPGAWWVCAECSHLYGDELRIGNFAIPSRLEVNEAISAGLRRRARAEAEREGS
jgi:hypothetical protein